MIELLKCINKEVCCNDKHSSRAVSVKVRRTNKDALLNLQLFKLINSKHPRQDARLQGTKRFVLEAQHD